MTNCYLMGLGFMELLMGKWKKITVNSFCIYNLCFSINFSELA